MRLVGHQCPTAVGRDVESPARPEGRMIEAQRTQRPRRRRSPVILSAAKELLEFEQILRPLRGLRMTGLSMRAVVVLLFLCAVTGHAQRRDTPLSQVQVPHSYYWREMYVPQVTSGPSALSWSPDGREVIYSMQGSLWRQRLGTTTAIQLPTGDT